MRRLTMSALCLILALVLGFSGCTWFQAKPDPTVVTPGTARVERLALYENLTDEEVTALVDKIVDRLRKERLSKLVLTLESAEATQPGFNGEAPESFTQPPATVTLPPDPDAAPAQEPITATVGASETRGQDQAKVQGAIERAKGFAKNAGDVIRVGAGVALIGIVLVAVLKLYWIGGLLVLGGGGLAVLSMTMQTHPEFGVWALAIVGGLIVVGLILAVVSERRNKTQKKKTAEAEEAGIEIARSTEPFVAKALANDPDNLARNALKSAQGPKAKALVDRAQGKTPKTN